MAIFISLFEPPVDRVPQFDNHSATIYSWILPTYPDIDDQRGFSMILSLVSEASILQNPVKTVRQAIYLVAF